MKTKRILKVLLAALFMCCLTVALAACGSTYTVTFNYNDGGITAPVTQEYGEGELIAKPTDPTYDGYTFHGWTYNGELWDFATDTVQGDMTLVADWSDPGTPGTSATITFVLGEHASDYATAPAAQTAEIGGTITLPAAPAAQPGADFLGWLPAGGDEPLQAGAEYTVTGSVAFTAQWSYTAPTTYTWTVTTPPTEEAAGEATGTPSGEGESITVELPALTAENTAASATPGKYHVVTVAVTCTAAGTETTYYTIPEAGGANGYAEAAVQIGDPETTPALGHNFVSFTVKTAPTADTTGAAVSYCTRCNTEKEVTVPVLGSWTKKGETVAATCLTDGYTEYTYKIDANVGGGIPNDVTVEYRQTHAAPGAHNWQISVQSTIEETSTLKVTITRACANDQHNDKTEGAAVTATLTFSIGEVTQTEAHALTGAGTYITSEDITYDSETNTFSISVSGSPYENATGEYFAAWSIGETAYEYDATLTVTGGGTAAFTATWTNEHDPVWANPTYNSDQNKVVFTCSICGEETKAYDITSLEIEDGTIPTVYDLDTAEVGTGTSITLDEGAKVYARGAWEGELSYSDPIEIPVGELKAEVATVGYQTATITVSLKDIAENSPSATLENVTLRAKALDGGSKSFGVWDPTFGDWTELGAFVGEFEIHFTLSDISRGDSSYQSWMLGFEVNGLTAAIREDNWMNLNFGRDSSGTDVQSNSGNIVGGNQAAGASATPSDPAYWNTLRAANTLEFTIARTAINNTYRLDITISTGSYTVTLHLEEPANTSNTITVYLGGESANYTMSNVYTATRGLTIDSISADPAYVLVGTALNDAVITVKVAYNETSIVDTITSGFTRSCDSYDATTPSTYTVTLEYEGKQTTVGVTVIDYRLSDEVVKYTVSGNSLTDGDQFSSTGGTVANNAFTPTSVISTNSPLTEHTVQNGGLTFDLTVYGGIMTGEDDWSRVFSFLTSTNQFVSVVAEGGDNTLGLHINYSSGFVDYAKLVSLKENGQTRLIISLANDGTMAIYANGALVLSVTTAPPATNTLVTDLTSGTTFTTLKFSDTDSNTFWKGLPKTGIVEFAIYDGIVMPSANA